MLPSSFPSKMASTRPLGDGEETTVETHEQRWLLTWHGPSAVPSGKPHGSAGLCIVAGMSEASVVLVSADGLHWDWPAGRPESDEDWEETLRREMREEACAIVLACRLLGFSRGHCVSGPEEGLVLVRALWRADVELQPWEPQFEINHRHAVPAADILNHLTVNPGYLPIYRRALIEAGLTEVSGKGDFLLFGNPMTT